MKAMVLAAGAGTRLRPLTLARPKPMVPVVNIPNIGHVFERIGRAGVKEVATNLHIYPQQIKNYAGTGKKWGIDITYSHEKELLGTAGSLSVLKKFFKDSPFFVLSGDGLCDLSLSELAAFHKRKKATATVVLVKTDAKFDYGLVRIDGRSRVKALLEKPNWGDIYSPYINTGIYVFEPEVLERIPDNSFFDFARDLLPRLIAENAAIYGYIHDGYWRDIGNLKEYRAAHKDILDGVGDIKLPGTQTQRGVWMGKNVRIGKGVRLTAPVIIGNGANIKKYAKINSYSIIGDDCTIGESAVIDASILWENVEVSKKVHVVGCVLSDNTVLKESVSFYEGAIIGAQVES